MTYQTIDKKIDKIIRRKMLVYENDVFHRTLCYVFENTEFQNDWEKYWKRFNKNKYAYLPSYISFDSVHIDSIFTIRFLTRLLVVEDFKLFVYRKRK